MCFPAVLLLLTAGMFLPPAGAATLSGSFTPLPPGTNINLTTRGRLDWVHWGLASGWSVERKYGVAPQITNTFLAPSGKYSDFYDGPFQLSNGANTFTWGDGAPVLAVTNTPTGVYIYGGKVSGNTIDGFKIQCLADTTLKTLRLYVGTSGAAGTLTATLEGAAAYTDSSLSGAPSNGVYTIDFQAGSTGQVLTVTFASSDTSGYLVLQAATLTGPDAPPAVAITAPTNGSVFAAPATFSLTATASDSDGTVTNLFLLSGATLLGGTNSGALSLTVSNQPGGVYHFVAVAADNAGLSITSFPATVFVTTGGGTLGGSVAAPPASLDLTAEGALDWAHWGVASGSSFDHKAGVSQLIPNVTPLNATTNNFLRYADNFTAYSWTDGTPTSGASGTTTGIFLYSTEPPPAAFQLSVPATNTPRQLKIFVGLYGDHARMEAWLSDWSAVPYTDASLTSAYHNAYAVYTFIYRSTNAGATLNVRWSPAVVLDPFYGNVTWQAATLSAAPFPFILAAPASRTAVAGSNVVLTVTAGGRPPLSYQWLFNGTNLPAGEGISGLHSNVLTLLSVTPANAGDYRVVVTNLYGSATSSAATLTVAEPPAITVPPSPQTIQCGGDAGFRVTADGTPPLSYQWSLDDAAVAGATGTNLLLTAVHPPDHTVTVAVANPYGSATNSVTLGVEDTLAPVITLNGGNPLYVELGSGYVEPGASAYDECAGTVPVTITGTVNTNVAGTNTLFYTADDGNGNTNTVTRTVIVQATPPPAPVLTGSVLSPFHGFDFSFFARTGVDYTVWYSGSFNPANWRELTNFPGTGGNTTINDSGTNAAARFYRVQAQ